MKRQWGQYEVLIDRKHCKVKEVIVDPYGKISLQRHFKRKELWHIVKGAAEVTIGEDKYIYRDGSYIFIEVGTIHRIENILDSPLVFVEIQSGEYCGEDDIERL